MIEANKEQRANLAKLADFLDNLTPEFVERHFRMGEFYANLGPRAEIPDFEPGELSSFLIETDPAKACRSIEAFPCGTCGCALGMGPAAGIKPGRGDYSWATYGRNKFGILTTGLDEGGKIFGWWNPNDPKLVAQKIRSYLNESEKHHADPTPRS